MPVRLPYGNSVDVDPIFTSKGQPPALNKWNWNTESQTWAEPGTPGALNEDNITFPGLDFTEYFGDNAEPPGIDPEVDTYEGDSEGGETPAWEIDLSGSGETQGQGVAGGAQPGQGWLGAASALTAQGQGAGPDTIARSERIGAGGKGQGLDFGFATDLWNKLMGEGQQPPVTPPPAGPITPPTGYRTWDEDDLLQEIGRIAEQLGLGPEGARVAMAIARTEGAISAGADGERGEHHQANGGTNSGERERRARAKG